MNLTTTDSQTTGIPLVIATPTQQPTARLQLRDAHGQVTQQWLVKSNKCTLGSAVSCSLRCELPGVAPYHALLVIGARQIFIRALAPELTRDGQPFNELLLTNDDSHFEIAGHRFELSRKHAEVEPAIRAEASSPQRIKFTLARPFELRSRSQAALASQANTAQLAAEALLDSPPNREPSRDAVGDSKWVAQLIQAAMQPLECQLQNLAAPLQELQRESRKQSRIQSRKQSRLRKRRASLKDSAIDAAASVSIAEDSSPAANNPPNQHTQLAEQVGAIAVKHSEAMDVLNQRVSDVSQQLQAIERIVAEQRDAEQARVEPQAALDSPQLALQSFAIEQLQQSLVSVSSTLERLQAEQVDLRQDDQRWKDSLQSQLGSLAQVIEGLSASVTEVHHVALRAAAQPATPQHWVAANDQLAPSTPELEQSMQPAVEPEVAPAESTASSAERQSSDEAASSRLPEWAQPHLEAAPPMWSTAEPDEAITATQADDELERSSQDASAQQPQPDSDNSTSLPSWWADDESETEEHPAPSSELLPGETFSSETFSSEQCASEQYASDQYASEQYASEQYASEPFRTETPGGDIAEQVYDSTSDCDNRISERVDPTQTSSSADEDSGGGEPSEEFFGLAQLYMEQHLCEAEPLATFASRALKQQSCDEQSLEGQFSEQFSESLPQSLTAAHELQPPADDLEFNDPSWAPSHSDAQESEEIPTGLGHQAGRAPSGAALSEQASAELASEEQATEVDDSDSVEEYMRKLLARMRGVPEEEVQLQQAESKPAEAITRTSSSTTAGSASDSLSERPAAQPETSNYASETVSGADDVTEPFDLEKYMPRALAPERSNSLAAMRELANSSARTAIHKSTRQRHVSSIVLKSVIACVGLVVGLVLLAINGLNFNIGLVATVASFMVAAIWGYDSISSIRPMLQNGLILKPQAGSAPAPAPNDAQE